MSKIKYAIFLMFLTTVLTSTAQILYKFGINNVTDIASLPFTSRSMTIERLNPGFFMGTTHISYIAVALILTGLLLYAIGAVVMITALKHGEVSVLYPIIATSYIWVSIGSSVFFDEVMNLWKWAGVFAIVMGVFVISYGSKNKEAIAYTEGL
jgi:drug/metabolite transporter (DMT)-like permease